MKVRLKETNTYPIIIHGNGKGDRMDDGAFKFIKEHHLKESYENDYRDDITIVSWKGGKLEGQTTLLEKSVKKFGYEVLNLPWVSKHGFWKDSQQKITTTLNAINDGRINTEYVMWLDNSDVMLLDSPTNIFKKFDEQGTHFVWNGEKNNYPRPDLPKWKGARVGDDMVKYMDDVTNHDNIWFGSYKYMNSGAGVGKTKVLKEMLERANELIQGNGMNDQAIMRIVQKQMQDITRVDRNCDIFLCCWGVTKDEVECEK